MEHEKNDPPEGKKEPKEPTEEQVAQEDKERGHLNPRRTCVAETQRRIELSWKKAFLKGKSKSLSTTVRKEIRRWALSMKSSKFWQRPRPIHYLAVLSGSPWAIFGHYLVVKQWSPDFNPSSDKITTMSAWIRVNNLPVYLYEENTLMMALIRREPIKVDTKTLHADRGRFARVCMHLDLSKPLKGSIYINGDRNLIEYENLNAICFHCGRYGHLKQQCPLEPENIRKREEAIKAHQQAEKGQSNTERVGSWMVPKPNRWVLVNRSAAKNSGKNSPAEGTTRISQTMASNQLGGGRYEALNRTGEEQTTQNVLDTTMEQNKEKRNLQGKVPTINREDQHGKGKKKQDQVKETKSSGMVASDYRAEAIDEGLERNEEKTKRRITMVSLTWAAQGPTLLGLEGRIRTNSWRRDLTGSR
ncbi:hypothetical protein V2J09_006038 [Rumex salicifolius]